MPGLDPGIQVAFRCDVLDRRIKSGDDDRRWSRRDA
jgi:hypothetical protein